MDKDERDKGFLECWDNYSAIIRKKISRYFPDEERKNDFTHTIQVILYEQIVQNNAYEDTGSFGGYLHFVIRNQFFNYIKRRERKERGERKFTELEEIRSLEEVDRQLEQIEMLTDCITQLTKKRRRLIELCYYQKYKLVDAAEQLNMKSDAVRSLHYQTKNRLRKCIEEKMKNK